VANSSYLNVLFPITSLTYNVSNITVEITPRLNSKIYGFVPIEENHGALLCKSDGI
jgi:hypothetical protein